MNSLQPLELARQVADELTAAGAVAVVLMGSHARGDANSESDLDLYAVGEGDAYRLERRDGLLVSTSWRTVEQVRAEFHSPASVGGVVPGWRNALILADSEDIAASLQREALAWSWDSVGEGACDRWVAGEITGYAEEVHKLVSHLRSGDLTAAAVQRSLLGLRMAMIMSVHLRMLYDTENALWNLVNERMGEPWTAVQSRALGLDGEPFEETCRAALDLYGLAAAELLTLLDERQRDVVDHACGLARTAIQGSG